MEVFENGGSASLCGRVKTEVFENGGSASLCGQAKTEVFENDYVTGIGMSQLKKQNGCFLIRFRWCSVDGRKRYKNASVDEKLFIRFQETENGGFRKPISVDRGNWKESISVNTRTVTSEPERLIYFLNLEQNIIASVPIWLPTNY